METSNIIALAGLGCAALGVALPYILPKPSPVVRYGIFGFGLLLLAVSAVETWNKLAPGIIFRAADSQIAISGWLLAVPYGLIFASLMWVSLRIAQWFWMGLPTTDEEESSSYTADQLIKFMKSLVASRKAPIKIVALPEWAELANLVEQTFILLSYTLELNKQDSDYVFRSDKPHGRVVLRADPNEFAAMSVSLAFAALGIFAERQDFAPDDHRGYIQIELGGAP